jgi:hypothetical protein
MNTQTGWKHRENVKTYYEAFMPNYVPPGRAIALERPFQDVCYAFGLICSFHG